VEDSGGAVDGAERTAALWMAMWTSLRSRGKPPGVRCPGRVSPGDRPGWGSAAPGECVPNGPEIFTGPISTAGCGHGEMRSFPLGIGLPNKALGYRKCPRVNHRRRNALHIRCSKRVTRSRI
jgi:hypothetical protein